MKFIVSFLKHNLSICRDIQCIKLSTQLTLVEGLRSDISSKETEIHRQASIIEEQQEKINEILVNLETFSDQDRTVKV